MSFSRVRGTAGQVQGLDCSPLEQRRFLTRDIYFWSFIFHRFLSCILLLIINEYLQNILKKNYIYKNHKKNYVIEVQNKLNDVHMF